MRTKVIFVLLVTLVTVNAVNAQQAGVVISDKTGWHKIGETTVDFKKEKDEVMVVGANTFASLKFKVTDAPVDLIDIEVVYDKGDAQKISVRTPIEANGESRVIDLKGTERNIKKIVFVYKTLPNRKEEKAHVEIWGMKTNVDKKAEKQ